MIEELEGEKAQYQAEKGQAQEQMRACKDSYASLKEFQAVSGASHEDVNNIIISKNNALSQLSQYCAHNQMIDSYYKGTNSVFSKFGFMKVSTLFEFLELSIEAKLLEYETSITYLRMKISSCDYKIDRLDQEIQNEKEEEREREEREREEREKAERSSKR